MNREQFLEVLEELKAHNGDTDYYMRLWFEGIQFGFLCADGNLEYIEVDERNGYVLVYNNDISMFVDRAEVWSI